MDAESAIAAMQEITDEDVRLFKCTLLARRFPGLKELGDDDIRQLILSDRKATGRKVAALKKSYPKSDFTPAPSSRDSTTSTSRPFIPTSPAEAKRDVQRPHSESYIGVGTPFDGAHSDLVQDVTSDLSKRGGPTPFLPSSPLQAKTAIQVDYFLNSNDTITKLSEKSDMEQRSRRLKEQYRELYLSRRGKTLH